VGQVVDLGIKMSTTLAGLGAALLLGLKSGLRTTRLTKLFVLFGTVLFVESALYAVWWRMGIAELWLNGCLALVAENRLMYRFYAHFYLFLAALVALGFVVLCAAFANSENEKGDMT
jgi:hypothetical protein